MKVKLILSVCSIVLCLSVAFMAIFAWFAVNDRFPVNTPLSLIGKCELSFSDDGENFYAINEFLFGEIKCNDTKTLYIKIVNKDPYDYALDISFADPSRFGAESPYVDTDGLSYYLGTQLGVVAIDGVALGEPEMLALIDDGNLVTYPIPIKNLTASPGVEMIVNVTIKFFDSGTDQNAYQNFALKGGLCSRSIIVDYIKL